MSYFVETMGLNPGEARNRLRQINGEVFCLVLEASGTILASGAGVSAVTASKTALVGAVERTGFASARSTFAGASVEQRAALDALAVSLPRGRVRPEQVAAAERALVSGTITREELVLLLKEAVDDRAPVPGGPVAAGLRGRRPHLRHGAVR